MKNFLLLKIFSKFIKLLNLEQDSQTVVNCILSGQLYLMFKPYLIAPFVLFFTCRPENVMSVFEIIVGKLFLFLVNVQVHNL